MRKILITMIAMVFMFIVGCDGGGGDTTPVEDIKKVLNTESCDSILEFFNEPVLAIYLIESVIETEGNSNIRGDCGGTITFEGTSETCFEIIFENFCIEEDEEEVNVTLNGTLICEVIETDCLEIKIALDNFSSIMVDEGVEVKKILHTGEVSILLCEKTVTISVDIEEIDQLTNDWFAVDGKIEGTLAEDGTMTFLADMEYTDEDGYVTIETVEGFCISSAYFLTAGKVVVTGGENTSMTIEVTALNTICVFGNMNGLVEYEAGCFTFAIVEGDE